MEESSIWIKIYEAMIGNLFYDLAKFFVIALLTYLFSQLVNTLLTFFSHTSVLKKI